MPPMKEAIHSKVRNLVKTFVAAGGSVLEISCGSGMILSRLHDDGYDVRGTNFSKHEPNPDGFKIDLGVDVMESLPYDDATFDCVLIVDVIEHIADHPAAVRNMSRVLRPGGHLIIASPNINRISSRLHFFLTGFFRIKRSFIGFDIPQDKAFAFHNHPPHLPVFVYHMHAHEIDFHRLDGIMYKPKSLLFWFLLAPLIIPATWYNTHLAERLLRKTPAAELLFCHLVSFKSLCAEAIVMTGRKRQPDEPATQRRSRLPDWAQRVHTQPTRREEQAREPLQHPRDPGAAANRRYLPLGGVQRYSALATRSMRVCGGCDGQGLGR